MNIEPDITTSTKPERTPLADNHRSKKKVRTGDDDSVAAMEVGAEEPQDGRALGKADLPLQKQLFEEGAPREETMDCEDGSTKTEAPMSFKDKLMGGPTQDAASDEAFEDLTIEAEDFSIAMDGLIPTLDFSERVKRLMAANMKYTVVVKLLGRFMRQATLQARIESLWKPTQGFKLTELEGGCYLVRLYCNEDYQKALLGGPWVVLGHYLTVHPWDPELSPFNLEIKHVYGWVRLPSLPFHYYHKSVLRTIGERIGEVLKIDYNTAGGVKARFARLAVKINLQKPLVSRLKLDGVTQYIEYEGLPTICYSCGCYGHLETICPLTTQQVTVEPGRAPVLRHTPQMAPQVSEPAATHNPRQKEDKLFGDWMLAPTKWKVGRSQRRDQQGPAPIGDKVGNRYEVLATENIADSTVGESQPDKGKGRTSAYPTHTQSKNGPPRNQPSQHKTKSPPTVKPKAHKQGKGKPSSTNKPPQAQPSPNPESIFQTPAYQSARQPTSLNEAHHTVIAISDHNQDIHMAPTHIPNITLQKTKATLGKENISPRPPDTSQNKGGIRIQNSIKVRTLKTKFKDALGGPSEELKSLIVEALGVPQPSDEDAQYEEAMEGDLDDVPDQTSPDLGQ